MFQHATEALQGFECCLEASTVVAEFELVRLARAAVPEAAPALTR
jgi:hypothetical protein